MTRKLQAIRGMNDLLPEQSQTWRRIEQLIAGVLETYGYRQIRLPLLEHTELFARTIGEVTDIVEKEMYTFPDRNGDSLSLRPEGTAGVVRAGIEHGLLHNQAQRLWYGGPMFRHERPQRGRFRQFHQIGAECFGYPGPEIDAEVIAMTARCWKTLGLRPRLEINTLGTPESRQAFRQQLVDYLREHQAELDQDSRRRLDSNPLRILDSKNPDLAGVLRGAPRLQEHLDPVSTQHFAAVVDCLTALNVPFQINPGLVRGLDYYTHTVFEWVSDSLGAQGTICAGGRYDGLVEQLGGKATPAIGFALGLERLLDLVEQQSGPAPENPLELYFVAMGNSCRKTALALAEQARDRLPTITVAVDHQGGNLGKQMRRANQAGAGLVAILGEEELAGEKISVKFMASQEQILVSRADFLENLPRWITSANQSN